MGRKLSSWERDQRTREKEKERKANARAVQQRREEERRKKQAELTQNITSAENEVQKYNEFRDSLVNLHNRSSLAPDDFISKFSRKKEFYNRMREPVNPGHFKFESRPFRSHLKQEQIAKLKSKFKFKSLDYSNPHKDELAKLKIESDYCFEEFCKIKGKSSLFIYINQATKNSSFKIGRFYKWLFLPYTTIYRLWLSQTERSYKAFIEKTNNELDELINKDEKAKADHSEKESKREAKEKEQLEVAYKKHLKEVARHNEKELKREAEEKEEFNNSVKNYEKNLKKYHDDVKSLKLSFTEGERLKNDWIIALNKGEKNEILQALELIFPIEFDFNDEYLTVDPSDAFIGYKIEKKRELLLCVNLPEDLCFLPETGFKMTPSGRSLSEFKISTKLQIEVADRLLCSLAFAYLKSIFNVIKCINRIKIEIGSIGTDPKTGGAADLVYLQMDVDRKNFELLNLPKIDVLQAISNFENKFRSTKSVKNISPSFDRDELTWATSDDSNIKLVGYIRDDFKRCLGQKKVGSKNHVSKLIGT
jgi:hypothetical protein